MTVFQLRQAGALTADPKRSAPHRQRASGPLPPDAEPMAQVLHAAAQERLDLTDLHWGGENRPAGLNEATQAIVDRSARRRSPSTTLSWPASSETASSPNGSRSTGRTPAAPSDHDPWTSSAGTSDP